MHFVFVPHHHHLKFKFMSLNAWKSVAQNFPQIALTSNAFHTRLSAINRFLSHSLSLLISMRTWFCRIGWAWTWKNYIKCSVYCEGLIEVFSAPLVTIRKGSRTHFAHYETRLNANFNFTIAQFQSFNEFLYPMQLCAMT